ncbi:MAG: acyl-CoA thioesterase, partial [Deltaproteobacteria bacterium]|nr:acyl-CoA thioesterase [Deltaproteobacteria bacterium]
ADANHYGNVHGGTIMKLVDEAAFVSATRHALMNVVTASVDYLSFEHPVRIGDILILKSSVNHVGTTSMEIGVRIETENLKTGKVYKVGRAYLTMVGMDNRGRPAPLPTVRLETAIDRDRSRRAVARRAARLKLREQK